MKSNYGFVAREYDEIRPGYPVELYDDLISAAKIDKRSRLLEIGAGTGKGTAILAERGFKIDCIERDPDMAGILARKFAGYGNVSVSVSDFEVWECDHGARYDLVLSAQAFHWIDDRVKYEKCSGLLKDEGSLGLFWYMSITEPGDILDCVNSIFHKFNTGYACASAGDAERFFGREKQKLKESGFFGNISEYVYDGPSNELDSDLFIKRFNTTSAYASLDGQARSLINRELSEVINLNGGVVPDRLVYFMLVANRI